MSRTVRTILTLLVLAAAASARAEHRFALIIGNSQYQDKSIKAPEKDLKAVEAALSKHGFYCRTVENLDEKKLKTTIESFASTTPTRGTALIYFAGAVAPGSYEKKPGLCMLGTNSKKGSGLTVGKALEVLDTKGGSFYQIVVLDAPARPAVKARLPQNAALAFSEVHRRNAYVRADTST